MDFFDRVIIPFKDRRFIPKAGVVFGLLFIGLILSWGPQIIRYFLQLSSISQSSEMYDLASLGGLIIQLFAGLVSVPLYLYQEGYLYEATDVLRKGRSKDALPEHGSLKERLTLGGIFIGINITITLPFFIVIGIAAVIVLSTFFSMAMGSGADMGFALFSGALIILGLSILVMIALQSILAPAMMYIYLKERRFVSVFQFDLVREVVAESWWKFLLVGFALNVLSSLIIGLLLLLGFLTCCLIPLLPLVQPLIQTLTYMLRLGVTGEIYREMDESFKGTDLFTRE